MEPRALERKQFALEVKVTDDDEDKGIVVAKFAEMNVVDRGGDIIRDGAFGEQEVVVSAFNHGSSDFMGRELPVGKGRIFEKGNDAIAELQFFLNTEAGKEHFEVIKALGGLQEYSFGFMVTKEGIVEDEDRKAGADRIIEKVDVFEVSPVLLGEGLNTGTLSVKSEDTGPSEEEIAAQKELQESIQSEYERFSARQCRRV